jgi:hypothetical protein
VGEVIKIVRYQTGDHVPVICLCGSTKFKDDFLRVASAFTFDERIVLMPGIFAHADDIDLNAGAQKKLDELHRRKIDLADEIFVVNVGGYIGASTKKDIEYARKHRKPIKYLENND